MRLFVAVRLPPAAAQAAFAVLPTSLPALRRVPAELLHVTLAFLGETPEGRLGEIAAACVRAGASSPPFPVSLERVGSFPPRRGDAAVWLGAAAGATELGRLASAVRAELAGVEVEFDRKPFVAHVTLARIRGDVGLAERWAVAGALERLRPSAIRFRATRLEVVQSVLSPKGPRYSSLRIAELEGEGDDDTGGHRRDRARDA